MQPKLVLPFVTAAEALEVRTQGNEDEDLGANAVEHAPPGAFAHDRADDEADRPEDIKGSRRHGRVSADHVDQEAGERDEDQVSSPQRGSGADGGQSARAAAEVELPVAAFLNHIHRINMPQHGQDPADGGQPRFGLREEQTGDVNRGEAFQNIQGRGQKAPALAGRADDV